MAPDRRAASAAGVWGWVGVAVLGIVAAYGLVVSSGRVSGYVQGIVLLAGINITLAVSLNIINGFAGQFSIGHAGFVAVGAYVGAAVTVFGGTALERMVAGGVIDASHPALNLFLQRVADQPPSFGSMLLGQGMMFLAAVLAGLTAAVAGVLVGRPTLHLRGDYLAIATLGFGEIVRVVLINLGVVGGASGFNGIAPFGCIPSYANLINVYLVALACIAVATSLKRSTHGRALLALSTDEVAAESVGIDTTHYKVFAFALSAFFAGVAGCLLAHHQGNINPRMFNFMLSIEVIVMVVLGGTGSTTGCVLAAAILTILPELLRSVDQWRMVLYAEILLVMMLVRRQGLLGRRELCGDDWRRLWAFLREHGVKGPSIAVWRWLLASRAALEARLHRGGPTRFAARVALLVLLLPLCDLIAAWWLPPATQPYPRTYAAEIVASLSHLVHNGLLKIPMLQQLGHALQFPLQPNLGLSLALLILVLPWSQMAFGLADGDRRAGWGILFASALALWHGGGLFMMGDHLPRRALQAFGAAAALVLALVWLATQRRRR